MREVRFDALRPTAAGGSIAGSGGRTARPRISGHKLRPGPGPGHPPRTGHPPRHLRMNVRMSMRKLMRMHVHRA
jgi:hypothetical protein